MTTTVVTSTGNTVVIESDQPKVIFDKEEPTIITVGSLGPQGIQGFYGVQGIAGMYDAQGVQGVQGLFGIQGLQGIQGPQSMQGIQGPQGLQGVQGIQGDLGIQGIQGLQGPQGLQGVQGPQGLQGVQGPQGLQGIQGPQGLQGIQGFGIAWRSLYDETAIYNTNDTVFHLGSSWIAIRGLGNSVLLNGVDIKENGRIDCLATTLPGGFLIGDRVSVTGVNTGTGILPGYDPQGTDYYIIDTNGSSWFTISPELGGIDAETTEGTLTGTMSFRVATGFGGIEPSMEASDHWEIISVQGLQGPQGL